MTWAWIDTSRAQIGSSHDDEARARPPARGRCRCAGAGRRRTRAGSGWRSTGSGRRCSAARHALATLGRPAPRSWTLERLADDLADRHARIQAARTGPGRSSASGAASGAAPRPRASVRSRPSKRTVPARRLVQLQDGSAGGALAAAGFADQAERLARGRMANVMSSTARTPPTWRWKMRPSVIGKYIFRSSTEQEDPVACAAPSAGGRRRGPRRRSPGSCGSPRRLGRGRRSGVWFAAVIAETSRGGHARGASASVAGFQQATDGSRPDPTRPWADPGSRGGARDPATRQRSMAQAQRGSNGQPGGGRSGPAAGPRSGSSPVAAPRRVAGSSAAGRGCTGGAGGRRAPRSVARLDDPPGVHHLDPLGDPGDDAEVVGDEHDRHAQLVGAARWISSRIWAWIVTSRAVVGSSAMSSLGSQARAIAIITRWRMPPRELVRVVAQALARRRDPDQLEQLDRPASRPPCASSLVEPGSPRSIWSPIVSTGFSEVIGSWKIIARSLPRTSRDLVGLQLQQVGPVEDRPAPPTILPAGLASGP